MARDQHIVFVATSKGMLHMLLDDKPAVMRGKAIHLLPRVSRSNG